MVDKTKTGVVHPKTGEILEGVLVFVERKSISSYTGGFMLNIQQATEELALRKDTGFAVLRLFLLLIARLDFNNHIHVPQAELARLLGMQRSHVSRAMKRLEELDVIIRGPKVGRYSTYRLNPHLGWKGKAKDHRKALKELMDARGMRVVE